MPESGRKKLFYVLAAVTILINFGFIGFRTYLISIGRDVKERGKLLEGPQEKYRMAIFSFYIWENTLDNFVSQIQLLGGLGIAINALSAISAVLGVIGIHKKIPLLVRIWAFGLGFYLGWWAAWVVILAMFAKDFSVSIKVATAVTVTSVLVCTAAFYFVFALFSLAPTLRTEENEDQVTHQNAILIEFTTDSLVSQVSPGRSGALTADVKESSTSAAPWRQVSVLVLK